ncbi:MAG TPA: SDR family oxidoreductase, partial [Acidimicrobiales bacterium]|nr:SDR family oxidoreductase [Acidimicrobiales bacterium]
MSPLLDGRCIAVVGAGTQPSRDPEAPVGNGRAIAMRAAREGASVVCVDKDEAAVEETWRRITEEGGKAAIVVADVTTEEGSRLAVADESGLTPDGIVLNVGTGFGMGVAGTSPDDWD